MGDEHNQGDNKPEEHKTDEQNQGEHKPSVPGGEVPPPNATQATQPTQNLPGGTLPSPAQDAAATRAQQTEFMHEKTAEAHKDDAGKPDEPPAPKAAHVDPAQQLKDFKG